ncbi:DUF2272 domain-containing protein [Brevibacillus sp. NPDC058079]|uniref:DUF2272 domain-containing protein n=1 Tax=Brevibacillus sp. NPDC058079 TaxID=3346330 RepID=UPI0036E3072B
MSWENVRQQMISIAKQEFEVTWNKGTKKENDMQARIREYWQQGVYKSVSVPEYITIPGSAWSAAFISWVVTQAGGGDRFGKVHDEPNYRNEFDKPAAHWRYTAPAKINRQTSSAINPFWAFAIDEVRPQEGDIVVKSRNGSGATWNDFISKETHGDIVIDVSPTDITVIGGNVSDTVKQKTFPP